MASEFSETSVQINDLGSGESYTFIVYSGQGDYYEPHGAVVVGTTLGEDGNQGNGGLEGGIFLYQCKCHSDSE